MPLRAEMGRPRKRAAGQMVRPPVQCSRRLPAGSKAQTDEPACSHRPFAVSGAAVAKTPTAVESEPGRARPRAVSQKTAAAADRCRQCCEPEGQCFRELPSADY